MNFPFDRASLSSLADFFRGAKESVRRDDSKVERRDRDLLQKRLNIRAVSVREGFQAIIARSDEMSRSIKKYEKRRNEGPAGPSVETDVPEATETIVLQSNRRLQSRG